MTSTLLQGMRDLVRPLANRLFPAVFARRRWQELMQDYLPNGARPLNLLVTIGVAPCNHRCLFCPQSVEQPKIQEWLDLEVLRKVLGEMPRQGMQIHMSSYSETLSAPNLLGAVTLCKTLRPEIPVILATNGSVYHEDLMAGLMDAGLDILSYSFDAATRESYKVLIQRDNFDKVWNNLEKLVALRNRKGAKTKIHTHIMHFQGVEADFQQFRAHWEGKVDHVWLRQVSRWGNDELGLEKQMHDHGFVFHHQVPEHRFPCLLIFQSIKLQYNGLYYPCVEAIPAKAHLVDPLGDARTMTLDQAWDSLGAMRRAHLRGAWDQYACCRKCVLWSRFENVWTERQDAPPGEERFTLPGHDYPR